MLSLKQIKGRLIAAAITAVIEEEIRITETLQAEKEGLNLAGFLSKPAMSDQTRSSLRGHYDRLMAAETYTEEMAIKIQAILEQLDVQIKEKNYATIK